MRFSKKIHRFVILPVLVLLLIISLFTLLNTLIQKPEIQQYILKKVCLGFGMNVHTGKIELDILGTPGVVVHDVKLNFRDRAGSITASSFNISFSKRRLLMLELSPVSVDIINPVAKIPESEVRALFNKKGKNRLKMPVLCRDGVNNIGIENGILQVAGPSNITVNILSARVQHVKDTSKTFKISGIGKIECKGEKSKFNTSGTIDLNPDDLLSSVFSASLKTENTPLTWIPLPAKIIKIQKGFLSSNLNIIGSPEKGVRIGGSLGFKSFVFTLIHKERSKNYNIPVLNCNADASVKDRIIHIDSLGMKAGDIDLDVNMILDLTNLHNPYIKITAKSEFMPIETFRVHFPFQITPPWLEDKLFPMFQDGMVRMDNLVLDGTFDQFRHLKDEANRSVIGMSFTCRSFIVSNMGIQIPFKDISASVDIRDGNLKVSGLNGVFGTSQIKEGSLDVQGMVSGHPLYKVFVDGDFDIRELMSHREMSVIPETVREHIEKFKDLDGRLSARTTIIYRKGWKVPRILNGDYSFRNTLYYKRPLGLPLRFSRMDFHFLEDGDNRFSGEGVFGKTPFSASGTVVIKGSELLLTHADIKATVEMNQLVNECLDHGKFPFKFNEPLPWDISVDKNGDAYRYKGRIDIEKLVMDSDRLWIHTETKKSSVSFDLTGYTNGKIDINNIELGLGNSKVILSGEYYLEGEKLNTINVLTRNLSLGDFGIQFKGSDDIFYGLLDAGLDVSFVGKNLSGMQITGNLQGKSIFFPSRFTPLPVRNLAFRLDLSGKKGFISQCDMKFGDHPLHIKGILQGWDRIKGDLLATTDYIDLTRLIMHDRAAIDKIPPSQGKSLLKTSDIDIKISASKGVWRKFKFKRLNAEMKFTAKNILIKNAQAELETGDVSLSGKIGRNRSGKVNISGKVNLENQSIDKLISDMGFGDMGIKGALTLNSSVKIDGNISQGILKNLSGNLGKVVIKKGLLKNSRVFIKILDLLNIPDKFRERPPDMREDGFYFENIEGTARINKGILSTEEFVVKSPAFNAVGSGKENLYKRTHNIRLLVQPLTNIDFIISHIPIVGRILVGNNETLFTVGYDVTGTWSKPDLSIVPMENLKGLLGVFKRALLTPYKIIEDINNAAKSIKKTASDKTDNNESTKNKQP